MSIEDVEVPKFQLFRTYKDSFHDEYRYWFHYDLPDHLTLEFKERATLINSVRRHVDTWIASTYGDTEHFGILQTADRIIVVTTQAEAAALFKMSYG